MQRPPIFPNRDDKREHPASDESETQKNRRVRRIGGVGFRRLLQVLEEWTMAKPKPIKAVAVRSHDIMVRSRLRRVRTQLKWLSDVALTVNRLVSAVLTESAMLQHPSINGLCDASYLNG